MGVSCIVDSIAGKMGLVGEQNIINHMGVRINPTAQFQLATHVRRFKMLNALDVVQNWPPWSLDLNPLDYHVWGYMKAVLYAHKVNTKELLQQILSAARSTNNTAVLHKFTISVVTQVRKCIQADGEHFKQFALVLNSQSVTVHLTT